MKRGITRNCVIPAKAGIQQINSLPRKRDYNIALSASRVFFVLDSGLRRNDGLMDYSE
jgi:hypothetical protein